MFINNYQIINDNRYSIVNRNKLIELAKKADIFMLIWVVLGDIVNNICDIPDYSVKHNVKIFYDGVRLHIHR